MNTTTATTTTLAAAAAATTTPERENAIQAVAASQASSVEEPVVIFPINVITQFLVRSLCIHPPLPLCFPSLIRVLPPRPRRPQSRQLLSLRRRRTKSPEPPRARDATCGVAQTRTKRRTRMHRFFSRCRQKAREGTRGVSEKGMEGRNVGGDGSKKGVFGVVVVNVAATAAAAFSLFRFRGFGLVTLRSKANICQQRIRMSSVRLVSCVSSPPYFGVSQFPGQGYFPDVFARPVAVPRF